MPSQQVNRSGARRYRFAYPVAVDALGNLSGKFGAGDSVGRVQRDDMFQMLDDFGCTLRRIKRAEQIRRLHALQGIQFIRPQHVRPCCFTNLDFAENRGRQIKDEIIKVGLEAVALNVEPPRKDMRIGLCIDQRYPENQIVCVAI